MTLTQADLVQFPFYSYLTLVVTIFDVNEAGVRQNNTYLNAVYRLKRVHKIVPIVEVQPSRNIQRD